MKTLSFVDTLHPETADVYPVATNGSSTVWATVIHEVKTDLPVAVPIKDDDDDGPTPGQVTNISSETTGDDDTVPSCSGCCFLQGLAGCSLTLAAVLATFAIELSAAIIYCIAAGFYYVAKAEASPILIKAILMLVVHSLMLVDAILLTVSLIVTEILGLVTGLITGIFAALARSILVGKAWHAYVRKVCHLTRWAFRDFHHGWAPKRKYPILELGGGDIVEREDASSSEASVVEQKDLTRPVPVVVTHVSPIHRSSDHDRSRSDELRKINHYQV